MRPWFERFGEFREVRWYLASKEMKALSIECQQCAYRCPAEGVRLIQDRVEHRREVSRRRIDDPEHLGGRRLLLQRLACLGDEPCVFHCDDRLSGEVLQKRNLLVGEGAYLPAIAGDI